MIGLCTIICYCSTAVSGGNGYWFCLFVAATAVFLSIFSCPLQLSEEMQLSLTMHPDYRTHYDVKRVSLVYTYMSFNSFYLFVFVSVFPSFFLPTFQFFAFSHVLIIVSSRIKVCNAKRVWAGHLKNEHKRAKVVVRHKTIDNKLTV